MATTAIAAPAEPPAAVPGRSARPWQWSRRNPVTAVGFAIILGMAVVGLLAPVIAPYDPYALDPRLKLQEPSWSHLFGTGRSARTSSPASSSAPATTADRVLRGGIGLVMGCTLGAVAGFFGGPAR